MKLEKSTLYDYWIENENKFKSIVESMTYRPCGVWYTDAFLFCSVCDLLGVNFIIESGRAWGVSTEVFAKYFEDVTVCSFERFPGRADHIAQEYLSKLDNVKCHNTDVFNSSKSIVLENSDKNIGIFIDGPKGKVAQDNLTAHLNYENVSVFGYHDTTYFEENDFHTHDLNFIKDFLYLNEKIFIEDPAQLQNGELGTGCLVKIN